MLKLKMNANHKKFLITTISLFLLYFFLFVANFGSSYFLTRLIRNQLNGNRYRGFFFIFNIILAQNCAIVYMITIFMIYVRLSLACEFLEKLTNEASTEEIVRKLKSLAIFIDRISDTLDLMKACYSIGLIVSIISFCVYTVLSVYGFIAYYFKSHSAYMDLIFGVVTMNWELFYSPQIIWVFILSNLIERKGKRIGMLALRVAEKNRKVKACKKANLINMQTYHRKILIECGIFVVDYKLVLFNIGTVFSYLLIIIQFEFKNI